MSITNSINKIQYILFKFSIIKIQYFISYVYYIRVCTYAHVYIK